MTVSDKIVYFYSVVVDGVTFCVFADEDSAVTIARRMAEVRSDESKISVVRQGDLKLTLARIIFFTPWLKRLGCTILGHEQYYDRECERCGATLTEAV